MFLYWGRRGALTRFTLDAARAASQLPDVEAVTCVSQDNEIYSLYSELGSSVHPVKLFNSSAGAFSRLWCLPALRRALVKRLLRDRIQAVVTMMPHVWMPMVAPAIREAGIRYSVIVHDATAHPGDPTAIVNNWMYRDLARADVVFTLSKSVAGRLEETGIIPHSKLAPLFHPDLSYGPPSDHDYPGRHEPIRLLFLGRVLPHKGLGLLLNAVERLRGEGVDVEFGVFGEGALDPYADRLQALGAEVVNRWLSEADIAAALRKYHAVVLSHIEASQSGVAATALASNTPTIATPVGGLIEQIQDGETGVLASTADSAGLAEAVKRLFFEPDLYRTVCEGIRSSSAQRSMSSFVRRCAYQAVYASSGLDSRVKSMRSE